MAVVGMHLLIHGGINSRGTFLDSLVAFNIGNLEWI